MILLAATSFGCSEGNEGLSLEQALDSLNVDAFLERMATLSSDEMAGRRPGTAGFDSAAAYVVREARALGLQPGGIDGTYLQPILFRTSETDLAAAAFTVEGEAFELGHDFSVSPRISGTETDLEAPMIFAGFGISAPDLGYDDFEGIDVEGKLVVVISGAPDSFGSLERTVLSASKVRDAELRAMRRNCATLAATWAS